ncbi:MAG: methyltransferase domain-containing protein [Chloroflexi bacterium]|nr:methyltransferase domain-containing protein [Chloroflexota bacterium]
MTGPLVGESGGPPHILDVGTGSGVLALGARRRWPGAMVTGVDPSVGMLAVAAQRAVASGVDADDRSLTWLVAPADALPLPDVSVDLVISSFVLQLVPDRAAALQELRRVLRPGGRLAAITWLDGAHEFLPATEFDEAVIDLGMPDPDDEEDDGRSGDFSSPRAAADELRRAGFERVSARPDTLTHVWTPGTYWAFKRHYDEAWLFETLEGTPHLERLETLIRDRFAALPADAFTWQAPVVSLVAPRPA